MKPDVSTRCKNVISHRVEKQEKEGAEEFRYEVRIKLFTSAYILSDSHSLTVLIARESEGSQNSHWDSCLRLLRHSAESLVSASVLRPWNKKEKETNTKAEWKEPGKAWNRKVIRSYSSRFCGRDGWHCWTLAEDYRGLCVSLYTSPLRALFPALKKW